MDEMGPHVQHISQRYDAELEQLRSSVVRMGTMVEQQGRMALQALVTRDEKLAREVARSDHQVNEIELQISAQCTDILARRQPTAGDLRLVIATIRIVSNLERIGDEAAKIGKMAKKLADGNDRESYQSEPRHLGEGVLDMLKGALDAFTRRDTDAAINIMDRHLQADEEFKVLNRLLMTHMMEHPQRVKSLLRVNSCARAFERIGDHATNLCEEVIYLVAGSDVRHLSLGKIREQLED